jgi:hypothetical protein
LTSSTHGSRPVSDVNMHSPRPFMTWWLFE